jgi:Dinucleotide-utilizing enzymes involved in molybdopterin and thiamine biosynthesis family 2
LPTKYLLNDACVLKNKPLVYGSLYKFDGYVATFNVLKDNMPTANLRDAFPEMATDVKNCEDIGTLNSIVGTIALLQVNEVLKLITSIGKPLINKLLVYNALENTQYKINLQSRVTDKHIIAIFKKTSYFDAACTALDTTLLITAHDLQKMMQNKQPLKLISVTPNLQAPFKINTTLPLSKIETLKVNLANTYVIVCKKGLTSYKATQTLKQKYPALNVLSLDGGITNYKTHI